MQDKFDEEKKNPENKITRTEFPLTEEPKKMMKERRNGKSKERD